MPDRSNKPLLALEQTVEVFLRAHRLLTAGDRVVVGVSGGADSVAMLSVLSALTEQGWKLRLSVAHFHHGLRDSADTDAAFVADLADRLGMPLLSERRDTAAEAKRLGRGIEETARILRYRFLREAAEKVGATHVAVGHHADDNVETIVHRVFRGTHLRGLTGMPARRRLDSSEVVLIRPLLTSTKAEIQAYCAQRDLPWREDETNEDVNFRRNFIRHRLLPLLREKLNPRVDEALLRLASAAEEAETHLLAEGAKALGLALEADGAKETVRLSASSLASHPAIIQGYALRTALEGMGIGLQSIGSQQMGALTELLTSNTPKTICLPGGIIARRAGDQLVIEPAPAARPEGSQSSVALACPGRTEISPGKAISCQIDPYDEQVFQAHCRCPAHGVELLDADTVVGDLSVRPRGDGDAFVPLGAPGRQNVSDFLTNLKLPHSRRRQVVCVCDELGIIYLAPLRIDDRVKVRPGSRRLLRISFYQAGC